MSVSLAKLLAASVLFLEAEGYPARNVLFLSFSRKLLAEAVYSFTRS
jgi:hypothetical protein